MWIAQSIKGNTGKSGDGRGGGRGGDVVSASDKARHFVAAAAIFFSFRQDSFAETWSPTFGKGCPSRSARSDRRVRTFSTSSGTVIWKSKAIRKQLG